MKEASTVAEPRHGFGPGVKVDFQLALRTGRGIPGPNSPAKDWKRKTGGRWKSRSEGGLLVHAMPHD